LPVLSTPFERWLQVLKFAEYYNQHRESLPEELMHEEGIVMALDAMNEALADDQVRVMMALRDKAQKDEANRLHTARREGREEGRVEAARSMIAAGFDPQAVMSTLGLKPEDLGAVGPA
ncbi:MAG: hypothetical protein AB1758_22950, partial [Candidatus Eremiobacterota bacterium]